MLREDKNLLVVTHLSQLLDLVTGMGGLIVPLVLWLTQKGVVRDMDAHGKAIINFQISLFLLALICIPAIFLLGLGILGLIIVGVVGLVYPILNAIRVSNNEEISYPFFKFIK
jgi:uncharacterized Tic20 family protein